MYSKSWSSRRSATAAKRFFCKLLKGLRCVLRMIVTDKLKSYAAATRKIPPNVEHRESRYLNNRAEVAIPPMAAYGASSPFPRVPAKVPSPHPHRPLSPGGGNRS
jgi:hypothetical protein